MEINVTIMVNRDISACGIAWLIICLRGIGIVGVKTHDRAVCILVKIADWKSLHMFKHIVSHLFQNTLSDINHHSGVNKGGNHSQQGKCIPELQAPDKARQSPAVSVQSAE